MPSTSAMLIMMMTIKNRPILISPLRQESPARMNLEEHQYLWRLLKKRKPRLGKAGLP